MKNPMYKKIGIFSRQVVETLNLDIPAGTEIVLSAESLVHINERHPDSAEYIEEIAQIIAKPDYIGYSQRKNTVDFIRADRIRLCVPVRPSSDGIYFVRSLFKLHKGYFERLKQKNSILPVDKRNQT